MDTDEGGGWKHARSWLIIGGLTIAVVGWGLLIFVTVGDKGLPPWDYTILPDVPGESAYSTHAAPEYSGKVPKPNVKDEVLLQHVREQPQGGNVLTSPGGGR
jgi:hypothetical protein